jgi:hypothetical protein
VQWDQARYFGSRNWSKELLSIAEMAQDPAYFSGEGRVVALVFRFLPFRSSFFFLFVIAGLTLRSRSLLGFSDEAIQAARQHGPPGQARWCRGECASLFDNQI